MVRKHKKVHIFLIAFIIIGVITACEHQFYIIERTGEYFMAVIKERSKEKLQEWFEENKQDLEFIGNNLNDNLMPQEHIYLLKKNKWDELKIIFDDIRREEQQKKYLKKVIAPTIERVNEINNIEINAFDALKLPGGVPTGKNFFEFTYLSYPRFAVVYYPEGITGNAVIDPRLTLTTGAYPVVKIYDDHWQMIELTNRYKP